MCRMLAPQVGLEPTTLRLTALLFGGQTAVSSYYRKSRFQGALRQVCGRKRGTIYATKQEKVSSITERKALRRRAFRHLREHIYSQRFLIAMWRITENLILSIAIYYY